jgi:GMP synthase-like glutamine amidotransferase
MGVYDEQDHPWLAGEKKGPIEAAVAGDKAVLGICLGARLVSVVLGGRSRATLCRKSAGSRSP